MSKLWIMLMVVSITFAMASGGAAAAAEAMLQSGEYAFELVMSMAGALMLWGGLMRVAEATGDVRRVSRLLCRVLRPLFPGLQDEASWQAIGLNLSANMLGLGNAATAPGIRAAQLLAAQGAVGRRALAMLLALNCSSVQLMPTTVISLRAAAGSADAAVIWPVSLAASAVTTIAAAIGMRCVNRWQLRRERNGA